MGAHGVIYLDNAATTFPKPLEVVRAVEECLQHYAVNAGRGIYPLARRADEVIVAARYKCRSLLGFAEGKLIFTASATHALNQILLGLTWHRGDVVYVSPFEHNAVARVLHHLEGTVGVEIRQLAVDRNTLSYDLEEIEKQFFACPPKALVISHVSNVCGVIAPLRELAAMTKKYQGLVIVDGAQGGPLLANTVRGDIDFYVFSGHKTFYGPFGAAGFWTHGQVPLQPLLFGGTGSKSEEMAMPEELPDRYEAGSHNVVAIAGLQAACDWLAAIGPQVIMKHERELALRLVEGLSCVPTVKVYTNPNVNWQAGIISFTIVGYTAQEVAMILAQNYNIAVRAGLHCAPYVHRFLGTLPHGTVRVSFGYFNTIEDVDALLQAVEEIV